MHLQDQKTIRQKRIRKQDEESEEEAVLEVLDDEEKEVLEEKVQN